MSFINRTSITLNENGDSFSVNIGANCPYDCKETLNTCEAACKTHAAVMGFLDTHETDPNFQGILLLQRHKIKNSSEEETIPYSNIGEMKKYVLSKVPSENLASGFLKVLKDDLENNIDYDNYFSSFLTPTYFFLNKYSRYVIIGTIPAILKGLIATVELTVSISLFAFSAIPSLFSYNANLIFNRSFKHISNGLFNVITAVFQAIPIVGTVTYYLFLHVPQKSHMKLKTCLP